jgi:tetratricopeptide (TPR) repeat protein
MEVAAPDDHRMTLRKAPTEYAESYEAYLAGRSILRGGDAARLPEAIAAFEQATLYDSTFADAQAALAWSQMLLMEALKGRERSLVPRALNNVNRAILLGSRNPETYRAWSMVEYYTRGFDKAVERLEEAVRIAPSDGESYRRLALAQLFKGKGDLAQVSASKALEIDPSNPLMVQTMGEVSQFNGEFAAAQKYYARLVRLTREESIEALDLATDILVYLQKHDDAILLATDRVARTRDDPMAHYRLGRLLQTAGRSRQDWLGPLDRSLTLLEEQLRASPGSPWVMSRLALVQTRRGMFQEALEMAKRSMERTPVEPEVLYNISRMYALQRDRNRSLDYLRQAVGGHYLLSQILDMDYYTLRTDPGFISAVTR